MNKSKPFTVTVYLTEKKNFEVKRLVNKGFFRNKTEVLEKALDMLLSLQKQEENKNEE